MCYETNWESYTDSIEVVNGDNRHVVRTHELGVGAQTVDYIVLIEDGYDKPDPRHHNDTHGARLTIDTYTDDGCLVWERTSKVLVRDEGEEEYQMVHLLDELKEVRKVIESRIAYLKAGREQKADSINEA